MSYPFDLLHLKEEDGTTNSEKCRRQGQRTDVADSVTDTVSVTGAGRTSTESEDEPARGGILENSLTFGRNLECMQCKSVQQNEGPLKRVPLFGELSEEHTEKHWISVLPCPACKLTVGISVCGQTWTGAECLRTSNTSTHGILQVESYRDRLVLYVLSQVMFQQEESSPDTHDVTFLCPGPTEFGKIMWTHGEAAGFYTLKLKGSVYTSCSYMTYQMPVVDLVYVRSEFRRRGLASALVADVMAAYPDENIGFSEPVSDTMLQVLGRYLEVHADRRDHVWEVSWTGQEGFRNNIWLLIRRLRREKRIK